MQLHTGVPSGTLDSGQFSTLSYAESVFGDSKVDISRTDNGGEGYEVAPQHDHDQESHHLEAQLRVSEDMIMAATRCIDDMHALMVVLTACLAQRSTHYHEDYSMSETEMVLLGVLYTST